MARKFGFKPRLRDTVRIHAAYLAAMSPAGKMAPDLQASHDHLVSGFPKMRQNKIRDEAQKRAAAHEPNSDFPGVDIDKIHGTKRAAPRQLEAEVVRAIKQLVAQHPKILWMLRVNAGMASYEAKSGKWAPVRFHEWLRYPMKMRMPDFYGMLIDGRSIGFEAKKPGWRQPTDQREREQADFLQCIRVHGGIGAFVTSADQVAEILRSC